MAQGADAGAIIAGSVVLAAVLVAVVPGPGDRMGHGQGNIKTSSEAGIVGWIVPTMGGIISRHARIVSSWQDH